jgi:hypothetical protein
MGIVNFSMLKHQRSMSQSLDNRVVGNEAEEEMEAVSSDNA